MSDQLHQKKHRRIEQQSTTSPSCQVGCLQCKEIEEGTDGPVSILKQGKKGSEDRRQVEQYEQYMGKARFRSTPHFSSRFHLSLLLVLLSRAKFNF